MLVYNIQPCIRYYHVCGPYCHCQTNHQAKDLFQRSLANWMQTDYHGYQNYTKCIFKFYARIFNILRRFQEKSIFYYLPQNFTIKFWHSSNIHERWMETTQQTTGKLISEATPIKCLWVCWTLSNICIYAFSLVRFFALCWVAVNGKP